MTGKHEAGHKKLEEMDVKRMSIGIDDFANGMKKENKYEAWLK